MTSLLQVRTKSCPSRRFSHRLMPTTTADSPSQGSMQTQLDQQQQAHKQITPSDANNGNGH